MQLLKEMLDALSFAANLREATHCLNQDVALDDYKTGETHKIIAQGTALNHKGGNTYEILAGRHKGKTLDLEAKHVVKESQDMELPKPRNKQVNDVLRSKKGGRHFDAKVDYKRSKEKEKVRQDTRDDS